eukprot:1100810-Pleurochrysis_carterae.AAC.4
MMSLPERHDSQITPEGTLVKTMSALSQPSPHVFHQSPPTWAPWTAATRGSNRAMDSCLFYRTAGPAM